MHHKKSTDDTKSEMGSPCVLTAQKGGRKRDDRNPLSTSPASQWPSSQKQASSEALGTLCHLSGRALRCVLGKYYV